MNKINIELMAPAGNLNNFFACLKAGSDSIYLGFKKFNARRPAENFGIYELKKAISYAKIQNKKIYITLNIDLKSNELKEACELLKIIEDLKIDAVIVKDPALIYIINNYFKNINIHLSTQCAITSSFGLYFAETIGVKRAVMARELTLEELKEACNASGIEIEIFTEGSMCFSISGRCLMSSWVGSRSGNRGACTAPCRVTWQLNGKSGRYFAMKDLSLIKHLSNLNEAKIKALKIEGRLKNAGWVYTITSIYKKALENPDDSKSIEMLFEELKKYSAREKKDGHLTGHSDLIGENDDWDNYIKNEGMNFIPDDFFDKNTILITSNETAINLSVSMFNETLNFEMKLPPKPKKAKPVNLIALKELLITNSLIIENKFNIEIDNETIDLSSSFIQKIYDELIAKINSIIKEKEKLPQVDKEIIEFVSMKNNEIKRKKLLGDFPDKIILSGKQDLSKFLNLNKPVSTIVVYINTEINIDILKKLKEKYELILALPDIMYEMDARKMKVTTIKLINEGFECFEANSYEGLGILSDLNCNKNTGIGLTVMNHIAADYYKKLGFNEVYASIEADNSIYKSISNFSVNNINCMVYGKVELFSTRVNSKNFINNARFNDKFTEMDCFKDNEIINFVSSKPLSFIGSDYKKEQIYFDHLSADLRYFINPLKTFNDIFNITKSDRSSSFNFLKKLV